MKLTADTITDAQIRELRNAAGADHGLVALCDMALSWRQGGPTVHAEVARARCASHLNAKAEILNARKCQGRTHAQHICASCVGSCCTACGGPIDENEECRC